MVKSAVNRILGQSFALIGFLYPNDCLAWGHGVHAMIADLAQNGLTASAARKVQDLLQFEKLHKLSDISSWADEERLRVQSGAQPVAPLPAHSIRLTLVGDNRAGHGCDNFCVTKGLKFYSQRLSDGSISKYQRLIALKYVVHLVGDIHQPLHASKETGDKIKVHYHGSAVTLHRLWDSRIFLPRFAKISGASSKKACAADGSPKFDTWAAESNSIARTIFFSDDFDLGADHIISESYVNKSRGIIKKRIELSGSRLACLLNSLLKYN